MRSNGARGQVVAALTEAVTEFGRRHSARRGVSANERRRRDES